MLCKLKLEELKKAAEQEKLEEDLKQIKLREQKERNFHTFNKYKRKEGLTQTNECIDVSKNSKLYRIWYYSNPKYNHLVRTIMAIDNVIDGNPTGHAIYFNLDGSILKEITNLTCERTIVSLIENKSW